MQVMYRNPILYLEYWVLTDVHALPVLMVKCWTVTGHALGAVGNRKAEHFVPSPVSPVS